MFCPKCGEEIKDGSKFCKHCGTPIKSKTGAKKPPEPIKTSNNDDRNKKIIIGVLIAAIVILAIVFVGFGTGLFNNASPNAKGASPAQSAPAQNSSSSGAASVSLNSFPVSEAPALAQAIKNANGNFPINFKSVSLSKAQCLYILTKSISEISDGHPDAKISVGDPSYAPHPSGRDASQTIQRANYVDMSKRFSSWIESNGAIPNYVGIFTGGVPDISPARMLDICVSILMEYGKTHNLPASVNV